MENFKIAIVGAGPSGYFTAQAFQKLQDENISFSIDLIEKLPTPWGLLRSGVAPDHQKIKSVSKVFEKIAKDSNFKLFANVEVGKDVSIRSLRDNYDAVVLAIGTSRGKKLEIPGEELLNSFSSAEIVPWYNSHPDFSEIKTNFSHDTVVIIGAGNVALDIARILASNPSSLYSTDIAEHALNELNQSKIRKIVICARRGPEHASFTAQELRSLQKLEDTEIFIDAKQVENARVRLNDAKHIEKDKLHLLEVMESITKQKKIQPRLQIELKFFVSPVEFKGNNKVEEVILSVNYIQNNKVYSSDKQIVIKCGMVISAIGYESDDNIGVQIEHGRLKNIAGHIEHNLYTVGWAKRGPTGLIGTNKTDATDLVYLIVKNLKKPKKSGDLYKLLPRNHKIVNQEAWERINAIEISNGKLLGKPRIKELNRKRIISLGRI